MLDRILERKGQHPSSDAAAGARSGRLRRFGVPLAVTAIWLVALGAYGAGYLARLEPGTGAARTFPTLDLLFFGFAVVGPLAMVWLVALLEARAAGLSDALAAQSESALALAATVANLHEAVHELKAGTTDTLADVSARVERDSGTALARLDRATQELSARLEEALLDAVMTLERTLRERTDRVEAALETDREALERSLRQRLGRAEAALDTQRDALTRRLDADAARLARTVEAAAEGLDAAQAVLGERIAEDLAARGAELDRRTGELLDSLKRRLDAIGGRVDEALAGLTAEIAADERARQQALDEGLGEREERLQAAVDEMVNTVAGDVAPLLADLRQALVDTRRAVAANPPASAEELARLLGEAAQRQVAPERAALSEAVDRLGGLEEEARRLIDRIDRTSRLNPLMDAPAPAAAEAPSDGPLPELPFGALPRGAVRGPLNWTAVIRALQGAPVGEAGRHAVERARADPEVAALIGLAGRIDAALAEDGLHLADLAPQHSPAPLWLRFARGERGGEIAALAGIEDDVALAIAGARLRDEPDFRALALRLVASYARLIARAGAEIGADPRLVELAETPPGRAFLLLSGPTRALQPLPPVTLA